MAHAVILFGSIKCVYNSIIEPKSCRLESDRKRTLLNLVAM